MFFSSYNEPHRCRYSAGGEVDLTRLGGCQVRITEKDGDKGIEVIYKKMTIMMDYRI